MYRGLVSFVLFACFTITVVSVSKHSHVPSILVPKTSLCHIALVTQLPGWLLSGFFYLSWQVFSPVWAWASSHQNFQFSYFQFLVGPNLVYVSFVANHCIVPIVYHNCIF